MEKLSGMPNIGKVLEARLIAVGIESGEQLKSIGAREAFSRIRMVDHDACLSTLCALEGAVCDTRWHCLGADTKAELNRFFASLEKRDDSRADV